MPAVSNTSPILNLAIVGQLALLRQQFGQIQIPPAVLDELKIDEERPLKQFKLPLMPDGLKSSLSATYLWFSY